MITANNVIAVTIFIIACLSDAVDGHIARKYNLVTNFGKFMDPLADKLLVCTALICFVAQDTIPLLVVIVIIAREFIISGFRLIAVENGVVIAASYWGKFKTIAQMIACILLIVQLPFEWITVVEQLFVWLSLILTVVSLLEYVWKNRNVLKETK